jgi:DnaA-homolog protein
MRQLLLSLAPSPEPTLENFVTGRNAELLALLSTLARGGKSERFVYIWGVPGCGKTHLLHALCSAFRGMGVAAVMFGGNEAGWELRPGQVVLVDDVDQLAADAQQELFNVYNRQRDDGGILIAAGATPAARLPLRKDLVTRLGWGLVYQLHTLSDDEKKTAMAEYARARGFKLSGDVIDYLLARQTRDLPGLLALLEALDRYSLEYKRAVTIPLVRELLSASG